MKTIAVYGSSMVLPGSAEYEDSMRVGAALGAAGYIVMTGGYAGVMEAASKGASEATGHVIGVTTGRIESYRGGDIKPNQWVVDEIRHATLRERLMHLVLEADGYVCMPGGLGTLHELVTVWELMRVGDIEQAPIVCYGKYWETMLAQMYESPFIKKVSWDMLQFVDDPQTMIQILDKEFAK